MAPGGLRRRPGSVTRLGAATARFLEEQPHDGCFIPGNFHWNAIPPIAQLPDGVRPRIVAQVSAAISKPQRRAIKQFTFRWKLRHYLSKADAVVALSEAARYEAQALIRTAVHAIPLPALADDLPAPMPAQGRTIMAAGRLVPEKGFQDLISAFALLKDHEARLVIAGEGPHRAALEAQVAVLGLGDRIVLPGFADDIRPSLDAARLFVLSSHFEGYAAVIIEALAAGRPVVATDCTPATHELLGDPRFGRTVPIGDPKAMAAAIGEMLAQPAPDPTLLALAVDRFRIGPVARAYLKLLA